MEKELHVQQVEKKSGITLQYQYYIHITPDQTYYSDIFNSQAELDVWFTKTFEVKKDSVDVFHSDRRGE